MVFFFLMIRRPPRSTLSSSSAASDVYKRQTPTPARTPRPPCATESRGGWIAILTVSSSYQRGATDSDTRAPKEDAGSWNHQMGPRVLLGNDASRWIGCVAHP
eukprot:TRINITY_DN7685_c0_g1_i3.p1 TRINITY_DN7685_c0_g1~~TRINITY_DN7685_c0_g1_i3.p1  ORF type:complete len:103 (-),score=20.08 TRINITY_DN7685_c0_g1_i3:225-533(-)